MAITHQTALRNVLAEAAIDSLDEGTTNATGQIEIQTSGDVEVATCALSNPAKSGAAASGSVTLDTISDDTSATGGTAAKFEMQNRDETGKIFGSVTATGGGGDIELDTVTIPAAATVSLTGGTYTAPA